MGRATARMASVTFVDGAGSPTTVPCTDVGDFSASDLSPENAEVVRVMERGSFVGAIKGDDVTGSGSFSINVASGNGADLHETSGTPSVLDVLLDLDGAPALTTVNDFTDGPRLLNLRYRITDVAGDTYRDIIFNNCSFKVNFQEGTPSRWAVSFEYNGFTIAEAAIP